MKLQTPIDVPQAKTLIRADEGVIILGSCFVADLGNHLDASGIDVYINPFGTLYNPESIVTAVQRLESGIHFTASDCVEMGAGAGKICSFHHHTSFARSTVAEFLETANRSLDDASVRWKKAKTVIVNPDTARCWMRDGKTVSNCLKRPAAEFTRRMMGVPELSACFGDMVREFPDKHFIFTVSPVRHLGEGAHLNSLDKSTLLLGIDAVTKEYNAEYFPAYEIMMDELRDYRFFAVVMVHPTQQAVAYIWEKFKTFAFDTDALSSIEEAEKAFRHSQHRSLLR
ncbi:MAG: GSCFA domain-containing protein [Bacteroidales bacterium]|nr:GSCFA domain-containing protein [Bacteroidales bacterium]